MQTKRFKTSFIKAPMKKKLEKLKWHKRTATISEETSRIIIMKNNKQRISMLMVKISTQKRNKRQKALFKMNCKELNIKIFKLRKLTKGRIIMMNRTEKKKEEYNKLKVTITKEGRSTRISNRIKKNNSKMLVQSKDRKRLPTKKINHLSLTI